MFNNLKLWWFMLADRERTMLTIGGIFVALFVIYSAVWSPLSNTVSDYKLQVKTQRDLLTYLQEASNTISDLRAEGVQVSATPSSPENLLSLTERSLTQHQLSAYLKQVQQPKSDQVLLVFESAPLDQLMQWLQQLITTQNVKIVSVTADRLPVAGSANVKMVLMR
ncbi:MAG: type II secretion system protein M [Coxiellaceae bacterium]|nr:type II secretion system protein M [Coxiellaceae bacterium]